MARPGRPCSICKHKDRLRIESQLALRKSTEDVAAKFHVGRYAVYYHWRDHVSHKDKAAIAAHALRPGADVQELAVDESSRLLEDVQTEIAILTADRDDARKAGDRRSAAMFSRVILDYRRFEARLTGVLIKNGMPQTVTNILVNPDVAAIMQVARAMADRHPEDREEWHLRLDEIERQAMARSMPPPPLIEQQHVTQ